MNTNTSTVVPAAFPDPSRFALFLNVFVRKPAPASRRRVVRQPY